MDPTYIYTAGRLFTILCGVATIVATYALARRVAGRTAAVTAAALLAVAPLAVRDAHYVKHDVPVTLLIVLTHIALLRANERAARVVRCRRARGTVRFDSLLCRPAGRAVPRGFGGRCYDTDEPRDAVRALAVAALAGFVAVVVTSPFLFADPRPRSPTCGQTVRS